MSAGPANKSASTVGEVFRVFLRLGLTSFGGPVAHLGFFHDEFVRRRRWLDESGFSDLVALCQFLPGPASSQFGFAVGLRRAGWRGALAAWAGFTLPSALVMIVFALGLAQGTDWGIGGWLHGLRLAAVAIVAQAVWTMGGRLCSRQEHVLLALAATGLVLAWPSAWSPVAALAMAAGAGCWRAQPAGAAPLPASSAPQSNWLTTAPLLVFVGLLLGLPLLATVWRVGWLQLLDRFYRAGALVFGGGHVVLPLLQGAVVAPGWVSADDFLAGYGVAQALPGPLFTFAAYLGAASPIPPGGWLGGLLGLGAVFLPGLLLVAGALPWWERLRHAPGLRAALNRANAAVVGVLLAALITPIGTETLRQPHDWLVAAAALAGLQTAKMPSWSVVAGCAAAGWLLVR